MIIYFLSKPSLKKVNINNMDIGKTMYGNTSLQKVDNNDGPPSMK